MQGRLWGPRPCTDGSRFIRMCLVQIPAEFEVPSHSSFVSAMLICLQNPKFGWRILLGICVSYTRGLCLTPSGSQHENGFSNFWQRNGRFQKKAGKIQNILDWPNPEDSASRTWVCSWLQKLCLTSSGSRGAWGPGPSLPPRFFYHAVFRQF